MGHRLFAFAFALAAPIATAAFPAAAASGQVPAPVPARLETTPVPSDGDAADDPAIWVHPADPAQSVLLGTDKHSGLAVFDLAGTQIQFLPVGDINNVDVRYGFALGGQVVDLIVGGNRTDQSLDVYTIDPLTRQVRDVSAGQLPVTVAEAYGLALYHSWISGLYYAFVSDKDGLVEQYLLSDNGQGLVETTLVRSFEVGSVVEGMVADDQYATLYVGEENQGIWRYGAEPTASGSRFRVDETDVPSGHLTADVEGLAIYHASNGGGYLIASSQGSDDFAVYARTGTNEFIMKFEIVAAGGVDGCQETDGIDVTSVALGPAFPQGLFIAQDGDNPRGNQNFKIVGWGEVVAASRGLLAIDTAWNPRAGPPPVPGDPHYDGAGR